MKKLSLLLFTILILACDTEKPVVEEPEEPLPVVMEPEPIGHPLVADGTVTHGEVNVDPEPLNSDGFRFIFNKPFYRYWVRLTDKDGEYLFWDSWDAGSWDKTEFLWIQRMADYDYLEYNTEYKIVISAQNYDCDYTDIVIQFRTKPQRPVVGRPAPVIQERIPAVALGEHFRLDIVAPAIVAGNVSDGDKHVDPEPLNINGIHFEFDEPIRKYEIDLRLKGGASFGWAPRGLVERENMRPHIQIMPVAGDPLLEFDTEYVIDIFVQDFGCRTEIFQIAFRTKPKP